MNYDLSFCILVCEEVVTTVSCKYTTASEYSDAAYCDSNMDHIPLERSKFSWIKLEFDQAYEVEIITLNFSYSLDSSGISNPLSIVIWLELSEGQRNFFEVLEVSGVINNDIVFGRLIQTTSVKIGIETVSGGHLMSFEISGMEIFGCSLGNDSSFGKGFTYS